MPNYTARKSAVAVLSPLCIIFFWLVIPLIIQIVRILIAKNDIIEFYDDKVVRKSGLISKNETQSVFMGVYSVSISQSLFGRIFGYGDLYLDVPGKWDVSTIGIKDPKGLKSYLETKITAKNNTTQVVF